MIYAYPGMFAETPDKFKIVSRLNVKTGQVIDSTLLRGLGKLSPCARDYLPQINVNRFGDAQQRIQCWIAQTPFNQADNGM